MTKKKFTGRLAEPIVYDYRTISILSSGDPDYEEKIIQHNKAERLRFFEECIERLSLLFEHYGIRNIEGEEKKWPVLAFHLANDLGVFRTVPKHKPPRGRKRGRRSMEQLVRLYADVEMLKRERPGRRDSDAVHILATAPRFAARWGCDEKGEASCATTSWRPAIQPRIHSYSSWTTRKPTHCESLRVRRCWRSSAITENR